MDIRKRGDRIGRYFKKYLGKFLFNEFSPEFLAKVKAGDLMQGVPVPLRQEELEAFAAGEDVSMQVIAENMTWVMGADPHFKYADDYVAIISRIYGKRACAGVLAEGRAAAEKGELDDACIHFRAALCMEPGMLEAMFGYATVCREMYMNSQNEEYMILSVEMRGEEGVPSERENIPAEGAEFIVDYVKVYQYKDLVE
jgi:hypothetical protein